MLPSRPAHPRGAVSEAEKGALVARLAAQVRGSEHVARVTVAGISATVMLQRASMIEHIITAALTPGMHVHPTCDVDMPQSPLPPRRDMWWCSAYYRTRTGRCRWTPCVC